ncbi:phosphoethanolamine transferase domain-containing protein [Variovorax paradoxus]|uniref:phosphoethanolamine transferase domain-containing protein n=2 Tax=Variovorax paradoxus TaxID=34073 RepID=UPI0009E6DE4E
MLTCGVVIDPGMITDSLQTDVHQAAALATRELAAVVSVLAIIPAWMIWRQPICVPPRAARCPRSCAGV